MSRSYKKAPIIKDNVGSKVSKRFANRTVRHARNVSSGAFYRRMYESWDIHEYAFYRPLQREIDQWEADHKRWVDPKTKQSIRSRWAKWYYRK